MNKYKYLLFASPFNSDRQIIEFDNLECYWETDNFVDTGISWQCYDSNLIEYKKTNKTLSGYRGVSDSPIVPIDIDDPDTNNIKSVIDKISNLIGSSDNIDLFYSGRRGYHLEMPSSIFGIKPSENLPARMKRLVQAMDIGADESLYKHNGLYRLNNSFNDKGDRFKTRLKIDDIYSGISIDEIRELSKEPESESYDMTSYQNFEPCDFLVDLWEQTRCPDNTKIMVSGGVGKGYRNSNAYDTALSLKTQKISRSVAKEIIIQQNQKNTPPEPKIKGLLASVDSAYDGKYFKPFPTNSILAHLKEDVYWNELIDRRKVVYIRMMMDANVKRSIYKGQVIHPNQLIYGKTATAQRWGMNRENLYKDMLKFEKDGIIDREVITDRGKKLYTIITILFIDVRFNTHNDTHTLLEGNDN